MNITQQYTRLAQAELEQTRRHFFSQCGIGLGTMALAQLCSKRAGEPRRRSIRPSRWPRVSHNSRREPSA